MFSAEETVPERCSFLQREAPSCAASTSLNPPPLYSRMLVKETGMNSSSRSDTLYYRPEHAKKEILVFTKTSLLYSNDRRACNDRTPLPPANEKQRSFPRLSLSPVALIHMAPQDYSTIVFAKTNAVCLGYNLVCNKRFYTAPLRTETTDFSLRYCYSVKLYTRESLRG